MATPIGINHIVLNVRDMDASHKFWTETVGLKQVGEFHPRAEMGPTPRMQFYSGDHDGKYTHHDVALVENPNLPPPGEWGLFGAPVAINHIRSRCPTAKPLSPSWPTSRARASSCSTSCRARCGKTISTRGSITSSRCRPTGRKRWSTTSKTPRASAKRRSSRAIDNPSPACGSGWPAQRDGWGCVSPQALTLPSLRDGSLPLPHAGEGQRFLH